MHKLLQKSQIFEPLKKEPSTHSSNNALRVYSMALKKNTAPIKMLSMRVAGTGENWWQHDGRSVCTWVGRGGGMAQKRRWKERTILTFRNILTLQWVSAHNHGRRGQIITYPWCQWTSGADRMTLVQTRSRYAVLIELYQLTLCDSARCRLSAFIARVFTRAWSAWVPEGTDSTLRRN